MGKRAKGPGTVSYDDVSTIRMVAGGEKRHPKVIHDGWLKDWVGIGWVTLRKATLRDKRHYPEVG